MAPRCRMSILMMHFCPQCGSRRLADARFCVECGAQLDVATQAGVGVAGARAATSSRERTKTSMGPFLGVFGALVVFGTLIAYLILRQLPDRERLIASAPPAPAAAAPQENGQLPSDHPKVKLPKNALDFIAQVEAKAHANPADLTAWDQLGDVALRAAVFDTGYYKIATDAYAHVLAADPENLAALRGIGNLDFDQRKYDAAIAAYEHYLSKKPDDPDVRTDLGTMLLSSGAADQAIQQYQRVLEAHPSFFEATFNLGIAYAQNSNVPAARTQLDKALKLAPDDQARTRVKQMVASLDSGSSASDAGPGVSDVAPGASQPTPVAASAASPTTFRGAVEQAVRELPVAGDKVSAIKWTSDTETRVMMDNFPMDQMPPFAAAKFMADLKAGVDRAKTAYKIAAPVKVDICDAASGRVMQSVTE